MKKTPKDIIILCMCTINDSHMMHGYWNMECSRHNFLSFWTVFCPFTPLTTRKIKILTKMKKPGDIITWHMHIINNNHKMYGSEIWSMTKLFVILDLFSPFYPRNNLKNQNFEKMKKNPTDMIILNMCTINDNHIMHGSWDIERDRPNFLLFWTNFCPLTP